MPKKTTTPEAQDAILEPATPVELIKGLIRVLGHEPASVGGVEVSTKYVRVFGKDRSMRTHTVGTDWNEPEPAEEEAGDD